MVVHLLRSNRRRVSLLFSAHQWFVVCFVNEQSMSKISKFLSTKLGSRLVPLVVPSCYVKTRVEESVLIATAEAAPFSVG